MELLVGLLIAILSAVYLLYKKIFYYWESLGVPQFDFTFPEGNAKGLLKTVPLSQFLIKYYKKTKEIGARFSGIYMFIRPSLLIVDLDLVKTILVKDFNVFPNRSIYYNEKDDPVSAHLFNLADDPWRNLRHKISPTFTSGKLKTMFGTISDVTDKLLNVIDKQVLATGQLELKDTLARFTTDVIGSTAFGIECNSLEDKNSKFYEMGTKIFSEPSGTLFTLPRATREDISQFYLGITKEAVNYREKNSHIIRHDFMNLLVQMKKSGDLTVEQIAAQSFIFFLAGYETSSSTMTHCMFELSINENIQEEARQSVRAAIEKHGGLTYEAVADMHYLEQCVDETLRKYPVVSSLSRISIKDYKIPNSDVIIKKGQQISIPVHAIQWDESIYPEPEKFNPDRFTPEEKAKRHQFAYLPFGEGPRICIGMRFGIVEIKLGLAKLLLNYKFSLDRTQTAVPLKINPKSFVLSPLERIYLIVENIQSNE